MVAIIMSLLVGLVIPIVIIGINDNVERQEKLSCYSVLAACGLIFILIWGRDDGGINWFLLGFITIIVALNIKSPDILKGALATLGKIFPTYLTELRRIELSSSDEINETMSHLLSSLIKIDSFTLLIGLTPFFGQKQAFCVIIGTVLYILIVHCILVKSEQLGIALKNLIKSIKIKLHILNSDYPEGEAQDVEADDEEDMGEVIHQSNKRRNQQQKRREETYEEDELVGVYEDQPKSQTPSHIHNSLTSRMKQDSMVDSILHEDILPTSGSINNDLDGTNKSITSILGLDENEEQEAYSGVRGNHINTNIVDDYEDIVMNLTNHVPPQPTIAPPPPKPLASNMINPTKVTPVRPNNII